MHHLVCVHVRVRACVWGGGVGGSACVCVCTLCVKAPYGLHGGSTLSTPLNNWIC